MTDTMTPQQRHYCMSRIRSKNTTPEKRVRQWMPADWEVIEILKKGSVKLTKHNK